MRKIRCTNLFYLLLNVSNNLLKQSSPTYATEHNCDSFCLYVNIVETSTKTESEIESD